MTLHTSTSLAMRTSRLFRGARLIALAFALTAAGGAGAETNQIRIAYPSGMNGQIVVTMEKAGIAKKVGLDATFTPFQYGPPMMEALAAGSIDAVVTSVLPVAAYTSKLPGDVKIVSILGQSSHSLVTAKDSPIKSAPDVSGRKLGVSFNSDSHLDTLIWLKEEKLEGKVSLVNIAPSELAAALSNASVDAVVIRQPQVFRLQQQTGARVVHTWPIKFVGIVKADYLARNPETVGKYLTALRDSIFYIGQNREQAAGWFGEALRVPASVVSEVSKEDPNYDAKTVEDINVAVTPAERTAIEIRAAAAFENGLIRAKADTSRLFQ
ncbi:ABC transporter substrate-binding protein [Methylopila musalis]|uniref:ABC transporter substrate-binding protein n=1 Tax=Methylopila musalis TaxID=1134781 RepID=A0ABW3Z3N8_9HYPH